MLGADKEEHKKNKAILYFVFKILPFPAREKVKPISLHAVCVSSLFFY